jgi:3-oxoacyl-[acyl-carrier-protein] synthase-3
VFVIRMFVLCRRRHVLGEKESLSEHAAIAATRALEMAGISAEEVDMILLATSSPDDLFGSGGSVRSLSSHLCCLDLS